MQIKATMGYYFKNLCFDTLKTLIKSLCCGGFVYIVWYLCASIETMVTASQGLRILDPGFVNVWCLGNMSDNMELIRVLKKEKITITTPLEQQLTTLNTQIVGKNKMPSNL